VDPTLPWKIRYPEKLKLVALDFKDFLSDIVNNRQSQFCFKNAEFVKRNWHWFNHKVLHPLGHQLHHIKEEL
jgi:hypothetical protein